MAITLFGTASNPADNGTNTANPTAVTPPSNMQKGDLVILWVSARQTGVTQTISEAGGQTWNATTQRQQSYCCSRLFWCIFNGTWTANPSVSMGGATCNIVRMMVFRGDYGTSTSWIYDVNAGGIYSAPASPYTVTIPSINASSAGQVVVACWSSADDNTWGSLTSGWTAMSPAQVRNTSGSDQSVTNAWKITTAAGAVGSVSQNQATLGGDAGCYEIITFRQIQLEEYGGSFSISHTHSLSSGGTKKISSSITISSTSGFSGYGKKAGKSSITISAVSSISDDGKKGSSAGISVSGSSSVNIVGEKGVEAHSGSFSVDITSNITLTGRKGGKSGISFSVTSSVSDTGKAGKTGQIAINHATSLNFWVLSQRRGGIAISGSSSFYGAYKPEKRGIFSFPQTSLLEILGISSEVPEDKFGSFSIDISSSLLFSGYSSRYSIFSIDSISDINGIGYKNINSSFDILSILSYNILYNALSEYIDIYKDSSIYNIIEIYSNIYKDTENNSDITYEVILWSKL